MQRQRLFLIGGVALAIIAAFAVVAYITEQVKAAKVRAQKAYEAALQSSVSVLMAKEDIPRGSVIDPEKFYQELMPKQYVLPDAVTSMDRISGMVSIAPIAKGEQISLGKLSYTKTGGGLSEVTPVGKRAITISVDNISSLAGMLRPGNYIDVIAMIPVPMQTADGKQMAQLVTLPIFQNVMVLAVGQQTSTGTSRSYDRYGAQEEKVETTPLVTLALNPQEANLITFVLEQSKIRLILRSPADSKIEPIQPASLESLLQYLLPKEPPRPAPPPEPEDLVEIYRGLSKEVRKLPK
jgi:pilus assembly protein CpaB